MTQKSGQFMLMQVQAVSFVVKYINILHPPAFQTISHNAECFYSIPLLLPSPGLLPLTSFLDDLISVISLTAVNPPFDN